MRKISTYTITINPSDSVENDPHIYSDFEKDLGKLMEKFFFEVEYNILLSVDFK